MKIDYLDLLHPDPIFIDNICTIRHIKIGELRGRNYAEYIWALSTLKISSIDLIKNLNVLADIKLDKLSLDNINVFELWTISEDVIKILIKALSMFIIEDMSFNISFGSIDVISENFCGCITKNNFAKICDAIFQINYISNSFIGEEAKPKNKRAAEMLARLKEFESKKRTKNKKELELPNIISAICVGHNSYNMTNIWSLTVYQLYDQFFRQNSKNQIDVMATRWAAWGSEPFDFEIWYQSIK